MNKFILKTLPTLLISGLLCTHSQLQAADTATTDTQSQTPTAVTNTQPAPATTPAEPAKPAPTTTTPAQSADALLSKEWITDLFEVYGLAERHDPELRAAYADFQAVEQRVPQNWANFLPQISGSANEAYSKGEIETAGQPSREFDGDSRGFELRATQTIYNHAYWQRLSQANINAAQAEANYNAARQNLMLRVAAAYFNVLAANDNLAFAEAERKSVAQQLEQTKQRFEVGLIAITDVKESQAQYDQAVASEIQAQNTLSTTREALWTIINSYPEKLKPLAEQMPLPLPEPADKQHWVDKAMVENLNLIAADFARQSAQQEVDIQRSGHYPTIDVTARHNYSEDEETAFGGIIQDEATDSTSTTVMLSVNVPIFSGGGTHARVKEAVYRREATRERYEATRRQVTQQTRDAFQSINADISRVTALKQALVSSEAAYEATLAGYEVGTRNSVEVLTALRNVFAAKRDYAQTRYDYVLDLLRLKQAAGNLNMGDLQEINRWLQ
jgi:outer membrane protein